MPYEKNGLLWYTFDGMFGIPIMIADLMLHPGVFLRVFHCNIVALWGCFIEGVFPAFYWFK